MNSLFGTHTPALPKYDPTNKESMFFETEKDYLEYQKLNTKQISIKKKMVNKQKLKNPEYKF